jgi:hypothetical protein
MVIPGHWIESILKITRSRMTSVLAVSILDILLNTSCQQYILNFCTNERGTARPHKSPLHQLWTSCWRHLRSTSHLELLHLWRRSAHEPHNIAFVQLGLYSEEIVVSYTSSP